VFGFKAQNEADGGLDPFAALRVESKDAPVQKGEHDEFPRQRQVDAWDEEWPDQMMDRMMQEINQGQSGPSIQEAADQALLELEAKHAGVLTHEAEELLVDQIGGRWNGPSQSAQSDSSHFCHQPTLAVREKKKRGVTVSAGVVTPIGPRALKLYTWKRQVLQENYILSIVGTPRVTQSQVRMAAGGIEVDVVQERQEIRIINYYASSESPALRSGQRAILEAHMKQEKPTLLVGDFNCPMAPRDHFHPNQPHYKEETVSRVDKEGWQSILDR